MSKDKHNGILKLLFKSRNVVSALFFNELFKNQKITLEDLKSDESGSKYTICSQPADNGKQKTNSEWVEYFNKKEKQMISAPDLYQAGKTASDELISNLKGNYKDGVISSTVIIYNPIGLGGFILHNPDSKMVKVTGKEVPIIPVYDYTTNTTLTKALEQKNGVDYLQALFNTKDNEKTLTGVIENISKIKASNIYLFTQKEELRDIYFRKNFIVFGGEADFFGIIGNQFEDIKNIMLSSREVSISP